MRLPDKSASALTWLAVLLLVPGFLIHAPSGRFFFVALATFVAFIPLIFGSARRRIHAGIVAAICVAIVVASYPGFEKDQDSYRERVRQVNNSPLPAHPI